MSDEFITLCVVLLILTGAVFIFIGWFLFYYLRLNPKKAIKTTGNLVGFRQQLPTLQFSQNYRDYRENGRGRRPVVTIKLGKEAFEISAAAPDYSFTESDIGNPISVLYQQKFGIILLINNKMSIRNYIFLRKTLFWCFCTVGILLIVIGIVVLFQY